MSSTKKQPKALCAYQTPDDVAQALVAVLSFDHHTKILEPHVGGGAFARALKTHGAKNIEACEIDLAVALAAKQNLDIQVHITDFLNWSGIEGGYDLIVGNCPYSRDIASGKLNKKGKVIQEPCAELHVRKGLSLLAPGGTLAFLLRLAFLESMDRIAFWREFPAKEAWVLAQRPSFTGGETDSSAYALFVWQEDWEPTEPGQIVGSVKLLDWKHGAA